MARGKRVVARGGTVAGYARGLPPAQARICRLLRAEVDRALPAASSKIWHGGPVWFIGEVPIVGYDATATGVKLLFWNGQAFGEPELEPMGKFKAAEIRFESADQIETRPLRRWLTKARTQVWDLREVRARRKQPASRSRS